MFQHSSASPVDGAPRAAASGATAPYGTDPYLAAQRSGAEWMLTQRAPLRQNPPHACRAVLPQLTAWHCLASSHREADCVQSFWCPLQKATSWLLVLKSTRQERWHKTPQHAARAARPPRQYGTVRQPAADSQDDRPCIVADSTHVRSPDTREAAQEPSPGSRLLNNTGLTI